MLFACTGMTAGKQKKTVVKMVQRILSVSLCPDTTKQKGYEEREGQ